MHRCRLPDLSLCFMERLQGASIACPLAPLIEPEPSWNISSVPGDFSQGGIRSPSSLIKVSDVRDPHTLSRNQRKLPKALRLHDTLAALLRLHRGIKPFPPPVPAPDNEPQETVSVWVSWKTLCPLNAARAPHHALGAPKEKKKPTPHFGSYL